MIKTTKYNLFSFLPLAFLFQFKRLINLFFVIFFIIQLFPNVRTVGIKNAISPLVIVFGGGMLREMIEDLKRWV